MKDDPRTVRQFIIRADDDDIRLDRWFKRNLPDVAFTMVARWARTGQIRVNGGRVSPDTRLNAGQTLRVPPIGNAAAQSRTRRRQHNLTPEDIAFAKSLIIKENAAAIILNKPPGLATQGGTGTHRHVDALLDAFGEEGPRPRLVHRLDKDTSGVLLVARTPGSAAFFAKRFSSRSAQKTYWALVMGVPDRDQGIIDLPLSKQPGTGGEKMMVDTSDHGQSARTRYRIIDRAGNSACWVELQPLTGRTHQLRVHMAAIGHPIVGDGKYGGQDAFLSGIISRKMHLHARRLIIDAPGGGTLDVTATLPEHIASSMAQLGFLEETGDNMARDQRAPGPPTKFARKVAAKAHAKQYRKERRGERQRRRTTSARPSKTPQPRKPGPSKPGSRKPGPGKPGKA